MTGADDFVLMERVAARDSGALSALYERYGAVVYSLCLRGLRDTGDAEDLLVDVFWEVWDRADRYDSARGSPCSYLMGVARSRLVDRLRSRKSKRRINAEPASDNLAYNSATRGPADNPADASVLAERQARVRAAMASLSPPQRQALEMAFYDSMTHSEVAEALKEPIGTVKSRIRQALIQLRKTLGGEDV